MKMHRLPSLVLIITTVAIAALLAGKVVAQDYSVSKPAASAAAPQLTYGASEVLKLAHAKINDEVIVNYVQGAGTSYGLDANQIVYLKQEGVSDRVITTMLNQRGLPAMTAQATPPPKGSYANPASPATTTAQPTVTYVQPVQPSTVYVIPDTPTYDYYGYCYRPYYYCGWPWSFSIGWGGYYGGWHGWHGGEFRGFHGGGAGFHGGVGSRGGGGFHGGGSHRR